MTISDIAKNIQHSSSFPPVNKWNPDLCIGQTISIDRNGDWFYNNSIIKNSKIKKLFSTVLRNDDGNYFLVTPVEKVPVEVAVAPYVITDFECDSLGNIKCITNFDFAFDLDKDHPVKLREIEDKFLPVFKVRDLNIEGFLNRNTYYRFLNYAVDKGHVKDNILFIKSHGEEFPIGKID